MAGYTKLIRIADRKFRVTASQNGVRRCQTTRSRRKDSHEGHEGRKGNVKVVLTDRFRKRSAIVKSILKNLRDSSDLCDLRVSLSYLPRLNSKPGGTFTELFQLAQKI
jgi:hypothetical protein